MTEAPLRYISRLRLSHFRNYATAALDLDARHVVLTGANGSGKTNLLEAVSLLAPGRGLRRAPFDNLHQLGAEEGWAVAASVETPQGPADLGTGLAAPGGARRVRLNGANAQNMESLAEYIRILWLTPDMDGLFRGPAGDRRRFLDRLVMTLIPSHGSEVANFERAMRQRNRLLEQSGDPAWLDAIEAQMAAHAAAVHFARLDCLLHLQGLVTSSIDADAFPAAGLSLTSLFEPDIAFATSTQLEGALSDTWRQTRALDRAAGRTTTGPHRVDFEVVHAQRQMPAGLCSTGEQKALLIGLVLGHAHLVGRVTGITPLLLLDEVAAHLDPDRRAALFAALDALGTQCWMTGTDPGLFEKALGARHFLVHQGVVSPAD